MVWLEAWEREGGSGDSGGENVGFGAAAAVSGGVAKGTCVVEREGVGGPDEDGDIGSVTQRLLLVS